MKARPLLQRSGNKSIGFITQAAWPDARVDHRDPTRRSPADQFAGLMRSVEKIEKRIAAAKRQGNCAQVEKLVKLLARQRSTTSNIAQLMPRKLPEYDDRKLHLELIKV